MTRFSGGEVPARSSPVDSLTPADLRRWRGHFDTLQEAFRQYADAQRGRFALANVSESCSACGRRGDVAVVQATWDLRFPNLRATLTEAAGAIVHVHTDRHRHDEFTTYHPLCRACWRQSWAWRIAGVMTAAVGVAAVGFGGMMAAFFTIAYFGGTFGRSDRAQLPSFIALLAGGAVAGGLLWTLGGRWMIPRPLRHVAGRPVTLKRMKRRPRQHWEALLDPSERD